MFEYFVIGSKSRIARAFIQKLEEMHVSYKGFSRNQESIDTGQIFNLVSQSSRSKVIYFCSVTEPSILKSNLKESEYINVVLPSEIAKIARDTGTSFLAISSTRVFDGKAPFMHKSQDKNADTLYGQMKSRMEDLVLNANGSILRMTKVLQPSEKFLQEWARNAVTGNILRVYKDQFIAPIFMSEATAALAKTLESPSGLYQMSRMEEFSYLQLYLRFANFFKDRFAMEFTPQVQIISGQVRHDSLRVDDSFQDLLLDFDPQFNNVLENLMRQNPDFHKP